MKLQERFEKACDYPGVIHPRKVEKHLAEYLSALGEKRSVVQLKQGWELEEHPALNKTVNAVLKEFEKSRAARAAIAARAARDARAAIAAIDARAAIAAIDARAATAAIDARAARAARAAIDARAARAARANRAALKRFAQGCLSYSGWWWSWDVSWLSATYLGAVQLNNAGVQKWSQPVFEAFCSGCWFLFWTVDTLYWVAKPTLHKDAAPNERRLHNSTGPALESGMDDLYFWHGVLVPDYVVERPQEISVALIEAEENAEVRRIMIERYGQQRYLVDAQAVEIHRDAYGVLYRKNIPGDEPLVMVKVVNSTPEPDGSFKDYFLRVDRNMVRARQAVAWTFGKEEMEYGPGVQS